MWIQVPARTGDVLLNTDYLTTVTIIHNTSGDAELRLWDVQNEATVIECATGKEAEDMYDKLHELLDVKSFVREVR